MGILLKIFRNTFSFIKTHKLLVIFGIVIFLILVTNAVHEKYPDEFDSIVGGKYILQGKVPYRDWFQHHQPGAYVLAAAILLFSGTSFVRFRIVSAVAYFILYALSYFLLKKHVSKKADIVVFLVYTLLAVLTSTYYWGQMLLADTLAALLIIPALALLLIKERDGGQYELRDVLFVAYYAFFVWFTSMTYVIVVAVLTVFVWWRFVQGINKSSGRNKIIGRSIVLIAAPYIVFFLFFLVTGSLREYYFANYTYNSNYYIYNYPRPRGAPVNPVRYAVVIAHDSLGHFRSAITGVAQFPLGDPLNMTLAVSAMATIVYFALRGRYLFSLALVLLVLYENARGNPQAIRETDYQSSMYILTSLLSGTYILWATYTDIANPKVHTGKKVLFGLILCVVSIYSVFNAFFITTRWFDKVYGKYMGQMPLIYDRPIVAPILNRMLTRDDYAWVGPFEFEELFYLKARVPSKYHWFLDPAGESEKIQKEMIADFTKHPAAVIVFNRFFTPWGGDPKSFNYFFTDYLDKNYIRVMDLNRDHPGTDYKWKSQREGNFDFDAMVYLEKSRAQELLKKLVDNGYLELRPKSPSSK